MSADIELKLSLTPEQLSRLRAQALLRGALRPGGKRSKRLNTYYDTDQFLLRDNAIVLGVERSGDRHVQTMASPQEPDTATVSEISGNKPDVSRIAVRRWRKLLTREGHDVKLSPVFTTEVESSRVPLQVDDSRIDLALDVGHIRANGREQPICEARLALVAGQPQRLYQLALDLHDAVPFHIEHRDTILRGYSLLSDESRPVGRMAVAGFAADATVGTAFHALARQGLAHLCANEDVVLTRGNPDAVHQMRVAVRWLRALLTAFRPALDHDATRFLIAEFKWLQGQLGHARDWDVFLQTTLTPLAERLRAEPSLDELRRAAETARHDAYGVVRATLGDRRYTRLLLRLQLWLDSTAWDGKDAPVALRAPLVSLAERILEKRYRKLRKLGGRFAELSEAEMHEVRLRAKTLRYAAEFFVPIYAGKGSKKFIHALTEIQDTLGSLHDAIVGRELLTTVGSPVRAGKEQSGEARRTPGLERAMGVAAGFQAARIAGDKRRFASVWPRFRKLKKFWQAA